MKPLVRTYFNREEHKCNYEINNEPSETVPDQTMSIRTLLDRFAKGLPISGMLEEQWQEGEEFDDMPDINRLDLSERQELAQEFRNELDNIKKTRAKAKVDGGTESTVALDQGNDEGGASNEADEKLA